MLDSLGMTATAPFLLRCDCPAMCAALFQKGGECPKTVRRWMVTAGSPCLGDGEQNGCPWAETAVSIQVAQIALWFLPHE